MRRRFFDCKKHSNIKHHARYRRIRGGRYYKSIAKFKSEKRRRQQILKLRGQGCSIKQVAALLGLVAERYSVTCKSFNPALKRS